MSLADPHVLAIHCQVTMVNQEATVEAQAGIDGYPDDIGLMHWEWVEQGKEDVLSGCAHELAIRASS